MKSSETPSVAEPKSTLREDSPNNTATTSGRRPGVKQQTAYLVLPVYEQVRRLAFEENTKMHFMRAGAAGIRFGDSTLKNGDHHPTDFSLLTRGVYAIFDTLSDMENTLSVIYWTAG